MKKEPTPDQLPDTVGKTVWETWPATTRTMVIQLLQQGQTPKQIEASVTPIVKNQSPQLRAWEVKERAGRFYLAADYAQKNNLHLN